MALGQWVLGKNDEKAVKTLCGQLSISSLAARTLIARGYTTPELAGDFLELEAPLGDAFELKDMDKAAERINQAIENAERIAVFGDYDVDGVTATALMYLFLQNSGADVVCSLPARESSGYGISKEAIDNLKKYNVDLIITVDNGVSSYEEVEYANSLGIDVVVSDHHLPPGQLPNAVAVVNPLRADDQSPFKELAGVGVALKLCAAVEGCGAGELLDIYGYLVAMGTIADIMPLVGENRTIVRAGLAQMRECENYGLVALCEAAGIDLANIEASNVAFGISPRLNAAGRMDTADTALRLLITEDEEEAAEIANRLENLNQARRDTEAEIMKKISEELEKDPSITKKPIIIIAAKDLFAGVAGIVCSRLVEQYGKPVIIISIEGADAKGSGRSVTGFSLHEAIASCADMLQKYGGHEMAAGFTLATQDTEKLKERLFDYCARQPAGVPCPVFRVDALVETGEIDETAVSGLCALAPFGNSNEEPVFGIKDAEVTDIAPMSDKHSRITLKRAGKTIAGAYFGKTPGEVVFNIGDKVDAAFLLTIYKASHKDIVSVRFRDIRSAGIADECYDSIQAYNDFCAGHAAYKENVHLIAPERDDIAVVYRKIKKMPVCISDYTELNARIKELPLGMVLTAIDIMEELGIIVVNTGENGTRMAQAQENADKNGLENSKIYNTLSEEKDGLQRTEKTDRGQRQTV